MDRLSVTVRDRHVERLDEWQADENAGSRSEALREVLDEFEAVETESTQVHTEYEELRSEYDELRTEYEGLQSEYDDLHTKHEALQTKRDQLRDQLTAMNSRQEDVAELVEYVKPNDPSPNDGKNCVDNRSGGGPNGGCSERTQVSVPPRRDSTHTCAPSYSA